MLLNLSYKLNYKQMFKKLYLVLVNFLFLIINSQRIQ